MPFGITSSVIGGVTSSIGAGKQADAAKQAAQLQSASADKALAQNQSQFATIQQNEQPFIQTGTNAAGQINDQLPSLTAGFDPGKAGVPAQFSYSPTDFAQDPAFKFALDQGTQAIQRSAAAKGGLLGGATQKSLASYAEGTANQFYQQDRTAAQGIYQQNYGNAFNTFTSNQNNAFSKLATLLGTGASTATGQANTSANFANQNANLITGQGNAQSAGVIGAANAQAAGLGGFSASLQQLLGNGNFQNMVNGGGSSGGSSYAADPSAPSNGGGSF